MFPSTFILDWVEMFYKFKAQKRRRVKTCVCVCLAENKQTIKSFNFKSTRIDRLPLDINCICQSEGEWSDLGKCWSLDNPFCVNVSPTLFFGNVRLKKRNVRPKNVMYAQTQTHLNTNTHKHMFLQQMQKPLWEKCLSSLMKKKHIVKGWSLCLNLYLQFIDIATSRYMIVMCTLPDTH